MRYFGGRQLVVMIVAVGSAIAVPVIAQTYPTKPIRLIVPFAPGGGTDIVARTVAQKISVSLGQTVVVDNRAGAGGIIGMELVARSVPDGYTLLLGSAGPLSIHPSLYAKLPYDSQRDFAPVTLLTIMPFVLVVHPSVAASNVAELIALAKAKPGALSFASPGVGSPTHLGGELLKIMAGIDMVHVPYKGVAPATTDLIAGQIQVMAGDLNTLLPHVKARRVRALAVTSAKRSAVLPDLPPVADTVPGFDVSGWFGILGPAGTPRTIVARLNHDLVAAVTSGEVRERVAGLGGDIAATSAEQFGQFIRSEIAKWARVIKTAGVRIDAGR